MTIKEARIQTQKIVGSVGMFSTMCMLAMVDVSGENWLSIIGSIVVALLISVVLYFEAVGEEYNAEQ